MKKALSQWSKETYGNIFQQIATIENTIKVKEMQFEEDPSLENRSQLFKVQAELTRYLHLEEKFWKYKSGMKWFKQGGKKYKFFHVYIQGKRKRLTVQKIQNQQGMWLNNREEIGEEAVKYFEKQFTEERTPVDFQIINHIPKKINEEQNLIIEVMPTEEEVRKIVFSLCGESCSGPDGFTELFYQKCWDITGQDITLMVKAFFCGSEIPKFITHTNLVLISKKEVGC